MSTVYLYIYIYLFIYYLLLSESTFERLKLRPVAGRSALNQHMIIIGDLIFLVIIDQQDKPTALHGGEKKEKEMQDKLG